MIDILKAFAALTPAWTHFQDRLFTRSYSLRCASSCLGGGGGGGGVGEGGGVAIDKKSLEYLEMSGFVLWH